MNENWTTCVSGDNTAVKVLALEFITGYVNNE